MAYRKIAEMTEAEAAAARAYGSESGHFHLACQADHGMVLDKFDAHQSFLGTDKLPALLKATTSRYELTSELTVYSGHGNGTGVVGALGHSHSALFKGMKWQYRGFTSTSLDKSTAEHFVAVRAKHRLDVPVFLELRLPAGYRMLPLSELGLDMGHEAEILLPPHAPFEIVEALRRSVGGIPDVLHLVLNPF